jgi:hypothetical protein
MVGVKLFMPESWTADPARLARADASADRGSARSKSKIALAELNRLVAAGARFGAVLADASNGAGAEFRRSLTARRLAWVAGVSGRQKVYPHDVQLAFPWRMGMKGRWKSPLRRHVSARRPWPAAAGRRHRDRGPDCQQGQAQQGAGELTRIVQQHDFERPGRRRARQRDDEELVRNGQGPLTRPCSQSLPPSVRRDGDEHEAGEGSARGGVSRPRGDVRQKVEKRGEISG